MKSYYINFFIKSFVLLILLIINLPINNLISFYLFLFFSSIIIFSLNIKTRSYYYLILLFIIYFFIEATLPSLKIQEGHNLVIVNENSKNYYKVNLPKKVFDFFENRYLFYRDNSTCNKEDDKCWKNFDPKKNTYKSYPIKNIYSQSSSSNFYKKKYSRIVNNININNIKSAKIGEINNLHYNFFWGQKYDLVRENIPFFVMYEIPSLLINSSLCWQGNIFWENINESYDHIFNKKFDCKILSEYDVGKKIFGVSLGKGLTNNKLNYLYGKDYIKTEDRLDKFLTKNSLKIQLKKNNKLYFFQLFKLIVKISFMLIMLNLFFKFNIKIYLFSLLHPIFFFILLYFVNKEFVNGFEIFTGGNDGLIYSSYGNFIYYHLINYNFYEFFRGVESVFYFPSSLRFFWPINKFFFGDTFYGYIFFAYLYIIIIFFIFRYLFGFKWSIFLTLIVYFSRILEGYALSLYNFIEHINTGDAEPLAIFFFMTSLLIFIKFYMNKKLNNYLLYFLFGFFIFLSVSLRPNYLPTGILLLIIFSYSEFLAKKNKISIVYIFLGFGFIFLIPLHNYIYGNSFTLISSGHHHNTHVPINIYYNSIYDLLNLNFYNSENLKIISNQIYRWIKPEQLHYIITFIIVIFSVINKNNLIIKTICLLALSQHCVLLIFEPDNRYAYLAWILTFIISINFIVKNINKFYFKKSSIST